MKNIHVLPTDKPSRLYKSEGTGELEILSSYSINVDGNGKNIYITDDEEIKEGDWIFDIVTKKIEIAKFNHNDLKRDWKKIILTTDKDLIKDGVQAIDDEFLEWFVKNPSCEWVEVNKLCYGALSGYADAGYKIIIPKEELDYTALLKPVGTTQRQNNNLYSEEDMKKAFYNGYCCENKLGIEITFNEWFEQFKNK
jgi:hypothetical protein